MIKKILFVTLAILMLLSFNGCKSAEQAAADEWVEKHESLLNQLEDAAEIKDMNRVSEISDEMISHIENEFDDLQNALKEKDAEAAEEFGDKLKELTQKYATVMGGIYGININVDFN